ncbi:MAG: molybdopterin-dependent oxidoreductase [Pseudomonadota bacterium]
MAHERPPEDKAPETSLETNTPKRRDEGTWQSTACILCALNCGVKVQLSEDGREIVRTKGDENHPASQGYLCNKASRLNFYQNRSDRLLSPMRRTPAGEYEVIDWDTAIGEIAAKFARLRDEHGGDKLFYYGGGGQGNHLPGAYGRTTLATMGSRWRSNALAQEKTGEFWVAERMFGGYNHGDFEHAEVIIFLGKNPWQSHGFHRARASIREMAKDPDRTLIVIDPKRTETADLADIHLAVRPGRDAWLLAGMVATIVQEGLQNSAWLNEHARGWEDIVDTFRQIDIADCARKAGLDEAIIRSTARTIAMAGSVAVFEDLGVQMNRHSTLVSYLQRLTWLLGGNFGRAGTHALANGLGNIGSGQENGVSPVVGARIIAGLVPCNVVPLEMTLDHPNRYRGILVESGNPVHSLPDSQAWREAMRKMDISVVIDVCMTETAREADYVLPATTQFEKAEATFFNFEFPENYFHVRKPLFSPPPGVLDEAEIHMRIAEALDAVPQGLEAQLREVLENAGRAGFRNAVFAGLAQDPNLMNIAPSLLYRVLGPTLPEGMRNAAALWAVCQQHAVANQKSVRAAGHQGADHELGDVLFDALIEGNSGVVTSKEEWSDVWQRVPGGSVNLALDDMLEVVRGLGEEEPQETTDDFPFLLSAGERRTYTANTIIRDPAWRKKDYHGALYINPEDAARLNLGEGSTARISTRRGALDVLVELNDRMARGHVSLPNGMGLDYPEEDGKLRPVGVSPNELTSIDLADEFVGTPWHKTVPAQIEAID